jgi:hypothetical protein
MSERAAIGRRGGRGEALGAPGRPSRWVLCGLLVGGGLALAACSSASSGSRKPAADLLSPAGASTTRGGGTPKGPPGISGTVAAVDPGSSSMEVQNPETGQTTVSWTSSTTFVQTVSASLASVRAGDCVAVSGIPAGGASSTPSTVDAQLATVTEPPSGGSCTGRPTTSSGAPGGMAGFAGGFGAFEGGGAARSSGVASAPRTVASVDGTVQSVSGNTIVVQGFSRAFTITPGRRPTGSSRRFVGRRPSGARSSLPTTVVTVRVTRSTTYRETGPSSAGALAVGQCVTAVGPASRTGAVTARTVAISEPASSGCFAGIGRFGATGSSTSSGQASA